MRPSRIMFCNNYSVYFYVLMIFEYLWAEPTAAAGHGWQYGEDGSDDEWTGLCRTGQYQSPIDLGPLTSAVGKLGDITFHHYDGKYCGKILNNGHSVAVYLTSNNDKDLQMKGAGLSGVYKLDHLHFHWKSEHTMSRTRYALECHFVHKNLKYKTIKEAIKHREGIAVIATLFHVSLNDNPGLDQILNQIEESVWNTPGLSKNLTEEISPICFLPADRTGFYRYYGSLTTPTCDESVVWTVFTESLPISQEQFERFRRLKSDNGELKANNRPIKPINGRLVIYQESKKKAKQYACGSSNESIGHVFLTSLVSVFAVVVNFIHVMLFV